MICDTYSYRGGELENELQLLDSDYLQTLGSLRRGIWGSHQTDLSVTNAHSKTFREINSDKNAFKSDRVHYAMIRF